MESNKRKTFSIDAEIYDRIKEYCEKHDLKISKYIERILFQHIINAEKENGNV